jgi:uncharacterized protein (DUF302 family)
MVEMRKFAMVIQLKTSFDLAKARVIEALGREGFGVLSEIDVTATMKKKLGVEMRPYVILGACNPTLAHQALEAEANLGVLMPCNVVVYADDAAGCTVAAVDPVVQFSKVQDPRIEPVAIEVRNRMLRVLEDLQSQ